LRNIEKALDIRQRAFGELHPDTATSLNDLAATCNRLGEYDKALAQHQRSLAIGGSCPETNGWTLPPP
jgi:Flp pilus assembly protein TadD